jgi:drug/metabolite transporter (DMT)-like permease
MKVEAAPKVPVRDLLVDVALVGVTASWALSFVVTKAVVAVIHSSALALGLLIVISALSFAWLRMAEGSVRIDQQSLPAVALSGLCGYALFRLTSNFGMTHGSVFSSTVLLATTPLWASLLARAWGKERVSGLQWTGQIITLVGIAAFGGKEVLQALRGQGGPGLGDLLFVAAAIAWALYGVINRQLLQRYSALRLTSWSTLMGVLFLLPFTWSSLAAQDWTAVPPAMWLGLTYTALVPTLIAHPLWNWAIGRRGAAAVTPYMNLVPVLGGVLAWVMLGEVPRLIQGFAACVVLCGLMLARRPS